MPRRFAPRLFLTILQKVKIGGEGEIRTRDGLAAITVFETVLFNRSSTSPGGPGWDRTIDPAIISRMLYHWATGPSHGNKPFLEDGAVSMGRRKLFGYYFLKLFFFYGFFFNK